MLVLLIALALVLALAARVANDTRQHRSAEEPRYRQQPDPSARLHALA